MNEDHEMSEERGVVTNQWIISLAISIACCAVIFVIFAAYIMNLHGELSVNAVRIEMLREQQKQMAAELYLMRRPIQIQVSNPGREGAGGAALPVPTAEPSNSGGAAAGLGTLAVPEVVPGHTLPAGPDGAAQEKGAGEP